MKMFQEGSGRERQRIEAEEVVVTKQMQKDDTMIRVFCVCVRVEGVPSTDGTN